MFVQIIEDGDGQWDPKRANNNEDVDIFRVMVRWHVSLCWVCVGTTWRWHIKATSWNPMRGESPSRWQDVTKGTTRGCFMVRWNPSANPMCGKSPSRWQEVTKRTKNGCFEVRWNPNVSSQSNSPQGNLVLPRGEMFSSQGGNLEWLGYKTRWKLLSAKRP